MAPDYQVKQFYTCRFCGGKSKKCYSCKGYGTLVDAPAAPVSVVTWNTDVSEAPSDETFLMLVSFNGGPLVTTFGYRNSESTDNLWLCGDDEFWQSDGTLDPLSAVMLNVVYAYAEIPDPTPAVVAAIMERPWARS